MITIIIPFYNEESKNKKSLRSFLKALSKYISLNFNKKSQFILIDDGSTDKTLQVIQAFIKNLDKNQKKKILFISNDTNRGLGYTIRKGFKLAKTKYVTTLPSDNDLPFINYKKFTSKNLDFVMFYRSNMEKYTRGRLILSTLFTLFYNVAFDIKTHYIQATCLYKLKLIKKLIKKSNIKLSGTSYLAELATKLLRSNITFTEEPTYYKNKSTIDRTVSLKNLLMVIKDFILIYIDVNIINKSQYKKKAKKIYL